jgi:hypothetical protein
MEENTQVVINLIKNSPLDQTIKDILIRDVQNEGLTDFLKEQIKAYCIETKKKLNDQEMLAIKLLEEKHPNLKNPST